ncbi:hypothetical protein CKA38_00405 [Ereboglobus luteus]|uniref:Uncharacterized protein n=2 Tax=Ereboglobus luteus TaxID=1796921 RepID=A0A2U8E019_9BACT|nr:hypothetical protein CKA38_00405 [Ereboglobus luteus]
MPDILIYKGEEYSLHINPLDEFFYKNPDVKLPKSSTLVISSALWRGYLATFEIKNDYFFIKNVQTLTGDGKGTAESRWKSVINDIFKETMSRRLDWFSGLLILPRGKVVDYVHLGYASTFENYTLLEIDKGKCVKERHFSTEGYSKFKKKQFKAFKKTDEYNRLINKFNEQGVSKKRAIANIRNRVVYYSKKILVD